MTHQDKDEMLAFVSEEVERLKVMFTNKEQRLVAECESALSEHKAAKQEADSLRTKLRTAEQRADGMTSDVQVRFYSFAAVLSWRLCASALPFSIASMLHFRFALRLVEGKLLSAS